MTLKKTDRILYAAAFAVCIVMFGWLFFNVSKGLSTIDESFYAATAQRILEGDRLLLDEWHESQFAAVFLLIPHLIHSLIFGTTDGIILFMRYCYLSVSLIFYWFLFFRFKKYGRAGLIASAFFCCTAPYTIFTMSYYNMAQQALMLVCVILFEERATKLPAVFAVFSGFVFACAVLISPGYVLLYAVYCLFALLYAIDKKKRLEKYAFILEKRVWFLTFVGVMIAFIVFIVAVQAVSGIGNIIANFPNLFNDTEYRFFYDNNIFSHYGSKVEFFLGDIGYFAAVLFLILLIFSVFVSVLRKKNSRFFFRMRPAILLVLLITVFVAYLHSLLIGVAFFHPSAPLAIAGFVCCLLCEKKSPRLIAYLFAGLFASLGRDIISEASLTIDLSVTYLADMLFLSELVREIREELPNIRYNAIDTKGFQKSFNKRFAFFARAGAAALLILYSVYMLCEPMTHYWDGDTFGNSELTSRIDYGPFEGVFTSPQGKKAKDDEMADAAVLKEKSPELTYVYGLLSYFYFFNDNTNASYSTWFVAEDFGSRQIEYWKTHPDRLPEYFYYNVKNDFTEWQMATREEVLDALEPYCELELQTLNRGYLVHVLKWYFLED